MTGVAAVAIGRNEGARLERCLASLVGLSPVVYVDSGSTDGSVEAAQAAGAEVVALNMDQPFTAARARNAGLDRLDALDPEGALVLMIDGDCELVPGFVDAARQALEAEPRLAVVCGRRRERYPEASLWNRLTDAEWDTPVGEAKACGGDALIRRAALAEVDGYPDHMIAGEEPEMCFRMRQAGWRVRRIEAEMTLHDAALTRLSQWWRRTRRAGHAYAENAAQHGRSPERFRVAETRRALLWGALLPAAALLGALLVSPWALLLLLIYPLQILRLTMRGLSTERAIFLTFGKIAEAQGVGDYLWGRLRGKRRGLIEYK